MFPGSDSQTTCKYCGIALKPSQRQNPHCGAVKCKITYQQEESQKVKRQWEQKTRRHSERIDCIKAHASLALDEKHKSVALVEVPNSFQTLTESNVEKQQQFIQHLLDALDSLGDYVEEILVKSPFDQQPKSRESRSVLGALCGVCNGYCCKKARHHHAFIQRSTLLRVLGTHPGMTHDKLIESYASYFPEKSMPDSCIYHSDKGCTLPHEFRAEICGEFFCKGISDFIETINNEGLPDYVVAVSAVNCEIETIKILDTQGKSAEPALAEELGQV